MKIQTCFRIKMHSKFEPQWDYFSNLSRENALRSAASAVGSGSNGGGEVGWVCDLCDRSFRSARGLGVHRRAAHGDEFHAERVAERLATAVKVRWVDEEVEALARAEAVLLRGGARFVNAALTADFPDRTLEAVKGMRRSVRYKACLERARARLNEPDVVAVVDGDGPGEAVGARQNDLRGHRAEAVGEVVGRREPVAEVRAADEAVAPARRGARRRTVSVEGVPVRDGERALGPERGNLPIPAEPAVEAWREAISNWARSLKLEDGMTLAARQARGIREALMSMDIDRVHMEVTACLASMARTVPDRRPPEGGRPRRPEGRRAIRRRQCGRIQTLYRRNRGRAADECLTGKWRSEAGEGEPDRTEMVQFWRGIMEAPIIRDERPAVPVGPELVGLLEPVSLQETKALVKTLKDTSEGPDGVKNAHIRGAKTSLVALILNGVLFSGKPPENFKCSRTVMLPKVDSPRNPGEYRPISIANAYCRLFHKLLYSRLSPVAPLRETQKAFRTVDGTAANLAILDTLLRDARTRLNPLHLAFIDLRKAFDSVSHETIIRAHSWGTFGYTIVIAALACMTVSWW